MFKATTYLFALFVAQLATLGSCAAFERRQGPNTLYQQYPKLMTSSINGTVNVITIPKTLAQSLVGNRKLLPPTGLPAGFLKPDEHVLLTIHQLQADIRQKFIADLRVDHLATVTANIPYVDGTHDGKTPTSFRVVTFADQTVPAVVASLSGFKFIPAHFEPADKAYATIGQNQFLLQAFTGLDNPIDGPGLLKPEFQSRFSAVPRGKLSAKQFKALISQPGLRPNNRCDDTMYKFDEPFAAPFFAKADVQTGSEMTRTPMTFKDVESWSSSYGWATPAGTGTDCKALAQKA